MILFARLVINQVTPSQYMKTVILVYAWWALLQLLSDNMMSPTPYLFRSAHPLRILSVVY